MTDPPFLLKPKRQSLLAHSPTRHRVVDDILMRLSPQTAVDALSQGAGALKSCMDRASAAERDFAMRAAVASQKIWEWVDELTDWDWPTKGGSAGFENSDNTSRRLSFQTTSPRTDGRGLLGSLPARDVARYGNRIEEIHRDIENLAVEDIKSHVLTNHIIPLSRPSTPMSASASQMGLSAVSMYTKMEDLSAVITAIVLQTLPNLARLWQLLRIWSVRIAVLQRIPSLLHATEDAETGVKAGWSAISKPLRRSMQADGKGAVIHKPSLKRADFEVMNRVLVKKVVIPGRTLDYMLDTLEGLDDNLPDTWLDRVEAVERDYSNWVATCEGKIREYEWEESARGQRSRVMPSPQDHGEIEVDSSISWSSELPTSDSGIVVESTMPLKETDGNAAPVKTSGDDEGQENLNQKASKLDSETAVESRERLGAADAADSSVIESISIDDLSIINRTMSPVEEGEEEEEEESQLPPLRTSMRRSSNASEVSITGNGDTSRFDELSSDLPEVSASPPVPRDRIREAAFVDDSPPSSPPLPEDVSKEGHSELLEISVTADADHTADHTADRTDEDFLLKGALDDGSFIDDFDDSMSVSEVAGPALRRDSIGDQQLRQQISQIIEAIPAKIRLSSEPPSTVNLNPPDLQLPRWPKTKHTAKESSKRSASSLSSRTVTPSFTLSPARTTRPRHRGQQEIKVYHLSRSTGEPPIKLFIRCVGENGERVMVRVGGGWADLSEYLKEYAAHHGRRSGTDKARVEVRDCPPAIAGPASNISSSPPHRPASASAARRSSSPVTPLKVRKKRTSAGAANIEAPKLRPKTPAGSSLSTELPPSSEESTRSRPSSRLSWVEDDSSFLGLAGPTGKRVEMSEENKAWVESVKEKVRLASGERKVSLPEDRKRFGELGKVGGTKRLFLKAPDERKDVK